MNNASAINALTGLPSDAPATVYIIRTKLYDSWFIDAIELSEFTANSRSNTLQNSGFNVSVTPFELGVMRSVPAIPPVFMPPSVIGQQTEED